MSLQSLFSTEKSLMCNEAEFSLNVKICLVLGYGYEIDST